MKRFIVFAAVTVFFCSCQNQKPATVHLKGKLDLEAPITMAYNGAASALGDSRNLVINTDKDGVFDTVIALNRAEYFAIRRNTLYLSPGDEIEVFINDVNVEAKFAGRGAEANEYLKHRLFPKAGSFLEAGKNCRSSFAETKVVVDSLAAVRLQTLNALADVSAEFKDLETARINADVVNSYFSYLSYSKYYTTFRRQSDAEYREHAAAAIDTIAPAAAPLIMSFNDDKYLDVAVVRDVFSYESNELYRKCFEGIIAGEGRKELFEASKYVSSMRERVTEEIIDEAKLAIQQLTNEDFKTELARKTEQASKLLPGQPAIDIELETAEGEKLNLSDLKGKTMYIDLWATWCGPCKYEAPFFNDVAAKCKGKDILFIKISTDKKKSDWLKSLDHSDTNVLQYISNDLRLSSEWAVFYIPRFILIDKDFNIIDAYAKRPSEGIEINYEL
jgi:thiol-disulfide isomerase/thioredoxin